MAQPAAVSGTVSRPAMDAFLPALKLLKRFGLHLLAIIISLILMLPFFWALSSSLKQVGEVRQIPPLWLPSVFQWHNYIDVWNVRLFATWYWNSIFLTVVATTGTVISSSLAGYAFARFRFPGKTLLFSLTMATLFLPDFVLLIPNFMLFWKLGWLNTYLPLTIPFWCGRAFFIFLFRQFFLGIPPELDEAARIDGASPPRIFLSVILPLSSAAYISAAIVEGIFQWNAFLRPLIILNRPEYYPLQLGLRYFQSTPDAQPKDHLLMAAAILTTIPVLVLFFVGQRYFVRGVVTSGIKG
jgi:ABC-type glycerol-3-phosphate transport system permease component